MNPELATLRGLHLPATSSDLMKGEVVAAIALGFLAALLIGGVRALRTRRRATVRREAFQELADAASLDPPARLAAQARLLRRIVRTLHGDEAVSSRSESWARTLDRAFGTEFFSQGAGKALVNDLYRRPKGIDSADIDAELARLIARIAS